MFDTLYRGARERVVAVAETLTDDQLHVRVPATPDWTVRELLCHVVGVASDATADAPKPDAGDERTGRQVAERRSCELVDLLAEWQSIAPAAEARLAETTRIPNMAFDLVCHEGDLREALGLPRMARSGWAPLVGTMAGALGSQLAAPGLLEIHDETGQVWQFGSGEPVTRLRLDGYEIVRAAFSRRSQRQIAGWDWAPAPAGDLTKVGVFGPRDDDQPVPEP